MFDKQYYIKSSRRRRGRRRRVFRLILLLFFIFLVLIFKQAISMNNKQKIKVSPVVREEAITQVDPSVGLAKVISNTLGKEEDNYGIVVYRFKPEEIYTLNDQKNYDSASLYKLWIMATAFDQIKQGKLKENQIMSKSLKDLYKDFKIATDSALMTDEAITLSVKDAIEKMIIISDNNSALLLSETVGLSNVSDFLQRNGMLESKLGSGSYNPSSSPYDVALFMDKLYEGRLINKIYSDKMLSLLKRQRLNEKIPKYLPEGAVVAHKTGELDQFSHDGGIVYSPKGDYIIIVMSQTNDRDQANETIANLSKAIYSYFNEVSP